MDFFAKLLRVAPEEWENEFVRIRPMTTRDDLIYAGDGCRLTDEQREFVNPVWFSLGRAYLAPEDHDPCLIENERREPIGFLCFTAWADAYSWSYFLDVRQQGRGYGKRAAQLALRLLRLADPDLPVKLAVEAANPRAQRLYRSLGFRQLPERDGDDLVYAACLRGPLGLFCQAAAAPSGPRNDDSGAFSVCDNAVKFAAAQGAHGAPLRFDLEFSPTESRKKCRARFMPGPAFHDTITERTR